MTSWPALLATLMAILQAHPICEQVAVIETKTFSTPSPLSGDPLSDIEAVLQEVATFLVKQGQGVSTDD